MDDYISREAALNFEMEIEADPDEIQAITKGMALYADYIKKVPAADVVGSSLYDHAIRHAVRLSMECKTGKWTEIVRYGLSSQRAICECSVCNKNAWVYDDIKRRFKYCPNCGARMVGK